MRASISFESAAAVCAVLVMLGGCTQAHVPSERATPFLAPPEPATRDHVPPSTTLDVQLDQTLDAEHANVGDGFTSSVTEDLMAPDGSIAVPRGTVITGVVTQLRRSGRAGDQAAIGLGFQSIALGGRSRPIAAEIVRADVEAATSTGGALLGGVFGVMLGGGSGLLTGGLVGGAGGTLVGLGAGGVESRLSAGSILRLRTTEPIDLAPRTPRR
jgi:hypothetical protein